MHSFKVSFLVFEFLLLSFCLLLGRSVGIYEVLAARRPFTLVSEVNPGVSLIRIERGNCDGVAGLVEGRTVRMWYGDELVAVGVDGRWSLDWRSD